MTVYMTHVLQTYVLQLHGPNNDGLVVNPAAWIAALRETEENLTDLLPAGYRVEIKEWDE